MVAVGDEVLTGQKIAEAKGKVSLPLHASIPESSGDSNSDHMSVAN